MRGRVSGFCIMQILRKVARGISMCEDRRSVEGSEGVQGQEDEGRAERS